jgi:hypothetical protein
MAGFDNFKTGERVAHISCGAGVVTAADEEFVHVTYDQTNAKGRHWTGKYDRRWFELCPNYLFHRTARTEQET